MYIRYNVWNSVGLWGYVISSFECSRKCFIPKLARAWANGESGIKYWKLARGPKLCYWCTEWREQKYSCWKPWFFLSSSYLSIERFGGRLNCWGRFPNRRLPLVPCLWQDGRNLSGIRHARNSVKLLDLLAFNWAYVVRSTVSQTYELFMVAKRPYPKY